MKDRLLIVGNPEANHVGSHLLGGANSLGLETVICDVGEAFCGPRWISGINWHLRGHRPNRLREFSSKLFRLCRGFRPKWLLATGLAPIDYSTLTAIGQLGIARFNYLTDDPWNPAHKSRFFLKALPLYDRIFSTRQSNLNDLKKLGCRDASYLPFGYNPQVHFPQPPDKEQRPLFESDVVFVGGADRDRICYISSLISAGLRITLYGGYWERFSKTKKFAAGHIDPEAMRKALGASKIALCLVRRANRDGSSMRTFETPAIGACMLTEDTEEHRQIFGRDGEAVMYFRSAEEIAQKAAFLIENEKERLRLAASSHELITGGNNTYRDRLVSMIGRGND
jgi:spore maturation protein CgeB